MCRIVVFVISACAPCFVRADDPQLNKRLIAACFHVDIDGVVGAIREGADVNARYGSSKAKALEDPWAPGSRSVAAQRWTPLLALANSSSHPAPPAELEIPDYDPQWVHDQQRRIPAEHVRSHRDNILTILQILLSHKPDINADDGYGATALYMAVDEDKVEMAKVLLQYDANVNTKTGIYIDGPGDITPLHEACGSLELTKLLLQKGADPNAKDTTGRTPLDWAKLHGNAEIIQLYQKK